MTNHRESLLCRVFPSTTMDPSSLKHAAQGFPVSLTSASATRSVSAVSDERVAALLFLSLGRADLLELMAETQAKGSMSAARAILGHVKLKGETVRALKGALYANTSRLAQFQERQDVKVFAKAAARSSSFLLQVYTVGASGCKRADSHLAELRLGHGEAAELKFQEIAQGAELLEGKTPWALGRPFGTQKRTDGRSCTRVELQVEVVTKASGISCVGGASS